MNEYNSCRYCDRSIYIPVERRMMCDTEGLVPREHICPKFRLDPFKIKIQRPKNVDFSKYENEDYSIE